MADIEQPPRLCRIEREEILLYAPRFHHGDFNLDLYAPRKRDFQQTHDHDELYFVIGGHGWFVNGARRHRFGPGDCIFVPAGVIHRFEAFDDELLTWVMFWGPEGGEADPPWPATADPSSPWHWRMSAEAPAASAAPDAEPLFRHGSLSLHRLHDAGAAGLPVRPQDQLYVVHQGQGRLRGEGLDLAFGAGDALFVAAGSHHDFVGTDDHLQAWNPVFGGLSQA